MSVSVAENNWLDCGSFCEILSCYAGYIWRILIIDRGVFLIYTE
jgi:hypothetical protein